MEENIAIVKKEIDQLVVIRQFEEGILQFLSDYGLPCENIFVGVSERAIVFNNLKSVIEKIDDLNLIKNSFYLSKYLAATASGLFDAALNYLWDETIVQIRKRVSMYDLEFFYDNTVKGDKRAKFKDEEDLIYLQDSELIRGAKEIGLISDIGFQHLEFINYMRNWASAAHPNQVEITGLLLISWLETCIREVITLPVNAIATRIKELLSNLRRNKITESDAEQISHFFQNIPKDQSHNLALAFFGIYTRKETEEQLKQNIQLLMPNLWKVLLEDTKNELGLKFADSAAHGDSDQKKLGREFLEVVGGQAYIPSDLRAIEISTALDDLIRSHRGTDNFYNEPAFARELKRVVGDYSNIPKVIENKYVQNLVDVFLTNGYGIASNANPIYKELISGMTSELAEKAFLTFTNDEIKSKLRLDTCKKKFKELTEIIRGIVSSKAFLEFIDNVFRYKIPYESLHSDSRVKRDIENILRIKEKR